MPKLIIDDREVEVDSGATVLDAANKLGIKILTMCFLKGCKPSTSCMVCVVKVAGLDYLVPACGTIAKDSMRVESDSQEVRQARRAALELLLSDHVGDCMGPCQMTCSANMNIPLMIRQIASGKLSEAIVTVKKDIALPAVLGRICPAPCERACRRAIYDQAVSICLLKRYVADVDLQSAEPYLPACKPMQDKRVAIVGAGPAGLAAAYYLQQQGYGCTIFDEHEKPGGMLRYGPRISRIFGFNQFNPCNLWLKEKLPEDVLDKEIAAITKLGMDFQGQTHIGTINRGLRGLKSVKSVKSVVPLEDLRRDFDAVFVAVGKLSPGDSSGRSAPPQPDAQCLNLERSADGIAINSVTYETNLKGVFAGGDAVRNRRLTVRSVADGKEAAVSIDQYLSGQTVTGPSKPFNTHIGKLRDGEIERFMTCVSKASPPSLLSQKARGQEDDGFTDEQAREESARCLHCDCRKAESCKLRQYAQDYEAKSSRYKAERRSFVQNFQHPDVIYEPGKCINCGLCIQIAAQAGEELGLTFVGRGFDIRVAVPFDHSMADALKHAASKCVVACPTGALAFKDKAVT